MEGTQMIVKPKLPKIPRIVDFVPDLNLELVLTIYQPCVDQSYSACIILHIFVLVYLGITDGTDLEQTFVR